MIEITVKKLLFLLPLVLLLIGHLESLPIDKTEVID
jgi:hypothetical protein